MSSHLSFPISTRSKQVLRSSYTWIDMRLLLLALSFLANNYASAEHCACATGHVHARNGAGSSHTALGTLQPGECVKYHGDEVTVGTLKWAHVEYHGQTAYVADKWLKFQDCTLSGSTVTGQCACTTAHENVRDGPGTSHNVLETFTSGHCLPYKGDKKTADGYTWLHVDYHGKDGWMVSNWATLGKCGETHVTSSTQQLPGCPHMISRAEWGAKPPKTHIGYLSHIPKYVYIHHGGGAFCHDVTSCKQVVAGWQHWHMDGRGWNDIAYTFVVGEDGNVYVARGWDKIGGHTHGHNTDGLGFCVVGDFTNRVPNDLAQNALKQLIQCAVSNGKIRSDYILKGHRDVRQTACPGQKFYEVIQGWPHYNASG